jgi:hypothetical protein
MDPVDMDMDMDWTRGHTHTHEFRRELYGITSKKREGRENTRYSNASDTFGIYS